MNNNQTRKNNLNFHLNPQEQSSKIYKIKRKQTSNKSLKNIKHNVYLCFCTILQIK